MTTESGPRFNVSSERRRFFDRIVSPSLYWGVRTHTDYRVSTACWFHQHLFQQHLFPRRSYIQVLTWLNPAWLQWATGLGLQGDMAACYIVIYLFYHNIIIKLTWVNFKWTSLQSFFFPFLNKSISNKTYFRRVGGVLHMFYLCLNCTYFLLACGNIPLNNQKASPFAISFQEVTCFGRENICKGSVSTSYWIHWIITSFIFQFCVLYAVTPHNLLVSILGFIKITETLWLWSFWC